MSSLWKTRCCCLAVLACISTMHQVAAQGIFDTEDCIGPDCCITSDSELWRGMSCSMYAYLDDDPVLQMEGCAKHGEGCKIICEDTHAELTSQYKDCDTKYDKNVVYADWQNCFFNVLIAGLIKSTTNAARRETIPPENITDQFCNLLSQPGCPLCVKMRWGAPCENNLIKSMCRKQCKSCFCEPPEVGLYKASDASCKMTQDQQNDKGLISGFGDSCDLTCPAGTFSSTKLRCEHGVWRGVDGDASCMQNCPNTGITMPPGGTQLTRTGERTNDCSSLKHKEKCKLDCGTGTTASAHWQCYNGQIISTRPGHEPLCLNNCVEPPVPEKAEKFGDCTNVALDDPDTNFEFDWSSAAAYAGLTGKTFSVDFTSGVDTSSASASPLRDQLQSEGVLDLMAETCSVLKEENKKDPVNEPFSWRRLQPLNPETVNPGTHPDVRVSPTPLNRQAYPVQNEAPRRLEDASNASMYVPPHTPHGSSCELICEHPFAPDQEYFCWNGTWSVPKCTVQLYNEGLQWPSEEGSIVSYLGSLYANYNLEVITPSRQNIRVGEEVTVCAGPGLGCPTGQCFAAVPVEDSGRITTQGSQLRVRLGYDIEKEQRYGCTYEVTIPNGTVVAVLDRTVGNPELKWTYRLDPPPPRLMKMEVEPSFSSVFANVKYNGLGTIKCLTKPVGEKPLQEDFDFQVQFWTQVAENEFASGTITGLEERTEYSIFCQATGISGLTQSLVDVYDNERQFESKSKIPYAYSIEISRLSYTEITLELLYSTENEVKCAAHQREDGNFADMKVSLQDAVKEAEPKVFVKDPIFYTIQGLKPNLPTQVLCIAVSEKKDAKGSCASSSCASEFVEQRYFPQLTSDSWAFVVDVTTPAMTNTDLSMLTSQGCTLVPEFAPDRAVYACAVDQSSARVRLSAAVPAGQYSHLECEGNWVTSCDESFGVSDDGSTWTFNVRAQSGALAKYVIVLMTEAPVVPKQIIPQTLSAITDLQNMTVCAHAKSDILSKITLDKTEVQLLPGPWDLPILKLDTGSSLPSCSCDGCNVEMSLTVQGAGSNLTFVLFVEGVPTFSLDSKMQVHFSPPHVTDVIPPTPSVYTDTELTVYGRNFGGTNKTGTFINVRKVGPPIGLPAATWFAGCPTLGVEVSKRSPTGQNIEWVHWEFSGRYSLTGRDEYTMNGDRKILLTDQDLKNIDRHNADTRKECTPKCPDAPRDMRRAIPEVTKDKLEIAVGICCIDSKMDLMGFDGNLIQIRIDTDDGKVRRMPSMTIKGNVWQIDSNLQGQLRMHSETRNLRQKDGWIVKYRERPPGPGEAAPASGWGGRRLQEDRLSDLNFEFEQLKQALENVGASTGAKPRALWDKPPNGKNWWKNDKGNWECAEGEDQDEAVTALLEELGFADMVPKKDHNCELLKGNCGAAMFICACTCADYDPTPKSFWIEEVTVQCERCGDGVMVGWEQCDDGNQRDDDGCSRTCEIEPGWTCNVVTGCSRAEASALAEEQMNLCGPTTWVDDSTLTCKLSGSSRYPIALSVEVRGQESVLSQNWIQYVKPKVRTMLVSVLEVAAGSNEQWSNTVEFKGGQRIVLNGRSLPPTSEEGKKHMLTMLIGETILCAGVDVISSTQFECPISQPLDLERVSLNPEIIIRVGEVSSEGVTLDRLGLVMRQPVVDSMIEERTKSHESLKSPMEFNDTDLKNMHVQGTNLGSPEFGKMILTIGGSRCMPEKHVDTSIDCELEYVPVGTWNVQMTLGNIPAISFANVTVHPTYCHPGNKRVELVTSECTPCEAGTAEPERTPDFTCPDCANGMYTNETGQLYCKDCVPDAFSVPNRSTKEHCRCHAGFYHAYGNPSLAEECTRCEEARGFGWSTSNWTMDCDDCEEKYTKPPQDFFYYGDCPPQCYGLECSACPTGAVCFGNAAWPRVLPGFWAVDVFEADAKKIERCMPMVACKGDDGFGNMVCNTGYEGIRCGVCEIGFYKDQHICHKCPNDQWIFALIFSLFFVCVLIFGIIPAMVLFMKRMLGIHSDLPWIWRCWFMCCCCCKSCFAACCSKREPQGEDEAPPSKSCCSCCYPKRVCDTFWGWDDQLRKAPLLRTLAMCLNFGHTCYAFAMLQRPAVAWPDPSWELLSWTKLLTVDVEFMKPDCVVQMPFFTKWVGKFFMPFGLFALLFLITCYLRRSLAKQTKGSTERGRSSVWAVFRFTAALIIHVILIWHLKVALSPVDCNWCREGVTCLDEYTLIECWGDDPQWIKMMVISITDFIFVSGFFPIFLTITIIRAWRASARLDANTPAETGQISFTSFFVTGYKDRFTGGSLFTFGWEVVVLFRKLALIVSAKFTSTDPIRGANIQLLILLLSLVMQLTMRPYKAPILCNIDNFLCVMLFLSLLSACQLTMGGLGGMEQAYIALNIIALFGGAAIAILVCLRKLTFAYLAETSDRQKALGQADANTPVQNMVENENENEVKAMEADDAPVADVKIGAKDDQDSETSI